MSGADVHYQTGEDRFRNFYGQRGARLSRKDSIHGRPPSSKPTSYLFKILSPILFCAPDVHLMTMEELWVDKLTVLPYWTELFNKLNQEWMGHTVYVPLSSPFATEPLTKYCIGLYSTECKCCIFGSSEQRSGDR